VFVKLTVPVGSRAYGEYSLCPPESTCSTTTRYDCL